LENKKRTVSISTSSTLTLTIRNYELIKNTFTEISTQNTQSMVPWTTMQLSICSLVFKFLHHSTPCIIVFPFWLFPFAVRNLRTETWKSILSDLSINRELPFYQYDWFPNRRPNSNMCQVASTTNTNTFINTAGTTMVLLQQGPATHALASCIADITRSGFPVVHPAHHAMHCSMRSVKTWSHSRSLNGSMKTTTRQSVLRS
jgi:hypothetical protein